MTRQAKRENEKDMAKNIKHNSKAFFTYIRGKEQVRISMGPLRNSTGRVVSDESKMTGLKTGILLQPLPKNSQENCQSLRVSIEEVRKGFCRRYRLEWRK